MSDTPDVPNWRDIRTGAEQAWREFADQHGIRYHPEATRHRIATNVRAWLMARELKEIAGMTKPRRHEPERKAVFNFQLSADMMEKLNRGDDVTFTLPSMAGAPRMELRIIPPFTERLLAQWMQDDDGPTS